MTRRSAVHRLTCALCCAAAAAASAQTITAVHPATQPVRPGADFVQMLRANVNVPAATTLTSLTVQGLNTSDTDVAVASVYYTGSSTTFSAATPFGDVNAHLSTALAPASPTVHSGSWTNGANAFVNGGAAASIASSGVSHDFSDLGIALPTGSRVVGVTVELDAWNSGTGIATIGVQLSWDGGTTWTQEMATDQLPAAEATLFVGDAASPDFWGRQFTAAELANGSFRIRLWSRQRGGQSPTWNVDWARVVVRYQSTGGAVTFTGSQALAAGDNYFFVVYAVSERAVAGNVLDLRLPAGGAVVGGSAYPASEVSPTGSRSVDSGSDALLFADLESGLSGWTRTVIQDVCTNLPHPGWTSRVGYNVSPTTSFFWLNRTCPGMTGDSKSNGAWTLDSPAVTVPAGTSGLALTFWHRVDMEATFDGGFLQYRVNGGAWQDIVGARILRNTYSDVLGGTAPTAGHPAWNGRLYGFRFAKVTADLSGLGIEGNSLQIRWRAEQDNHTASVGWWIDDVMIRGSVTSTASRLAITSAAQTLTAGSCSAAVTIQSQTSAGAPQPATSNIVVALSSSSTGNIFYSDPACTTAVNSVTIASGTTDATFFFKDTAAGAPTITGASSGLTSGSQTQTILAGAPTKLAYRTPAHSVVAGACSPGVSVEAEDAFGNPAAVSANTAVTLTSTSSTLAFFSDPACSNGVTAVTISGGTTSTAFYFRDGTTGTPTVTASASGLTAASQTHTIFAGSATQLAYVTQPQSVVAGACSAEVEIESRDAAGNPAQVGTNTTVSLAATSPTLTFFSDAQCTNAVTSVVITAGSASVAHYFRDTVAASVDLTGTASGLTPATQTHAVVPGPAAALAFTTAAQTLPVATCSAVATVEARDSFGNVAPVAAPTTVLLSSSSATTGTFSDACATAATSVVMPAGAAQVSFHFSDSTATMATLTAGSSGLSPATQSASFTAGAVSELRVAGFASPAAATIPGTFTVSARDSQGNIVPGYVGTVAFNTTDAQAQVPADYTFTAADQGSRSFSATFASVGTHSLTATDGSLLLSGTQSGITVVPGPAAALVVSGFSTSTVGVADTVTVEALDGAGNRATSYSGTIRFTSSDGAAQLPPDHTFAPGGIHTFPGGVVFASPGTHSVTATDIGSPSITGAQGGIMVLQRQGGACAADAECGTGICADGVCCDTACTGACEACDVAGRIGTCGAALDGSPCPDGIYCNGEEACQSGACTAGTAVVCTDPLGEQVLACEETSRSCVATEAAPLIARDAFLTAAVGVRYAYNAQGRVTATGTQPITFAACAGPQAFGVDPATGVVMWTPSAEGAVDLCVSATNALGTDTYAFTVNVSPAGVPAPTARLAVSPAVGPVGTSFTFDGSGSSADPATQLAAWRWSFGDHSLRAFGAGATWAYPLPGGYQAELEVVDAAGGTGAARASVRVLDTAGRTPPLARIVASATSGAEALTVDLGCACESGDAPIVAHLWDLGTHFVSGATLQHTFGPGRYRVRLIAVDANGLTASDWVDVSVTGGGRAPPECRAGLLAPGGAAPLSTEFVASFADADGDIVSHAWTFDDGAVDGALRVPRILDDPGRLGARLTVRDSDGLECMDRVEAVALSESGIPPRIVSTPDAAASCAVPWRYSVRGAPQIAGTGPATWSVAAPAGASLPEGLTVDPVSGELAWTPSRADVGTHPMLLHVQTPAGAATQFLEIDVACGEVGRLGVGCGCGASSAGAVGWLALALLVIAGRRARG